jgi:Flp pilus assembly pilin Flp
MLQLYVRSANWLRQRSMGVPASVARIRLAGAEEKGQTTAEYALVILAAAAVALVLIAWAQSSGKLPAFFDKVIDDLINSF